MKSIIILVAGLPGSGKSYFASQLATQTGGVYISSDHVRKSMGAMGKYDLKDKLAVYREMANRAEQSLEAQEYIIIDATFYQGMMRSMFCELAKKHSSIVCLIHVTACELLIKERLNKPREGSEADFRVYQLIKDQFEAITSLHLKLESTNDNIESMLTEALAYISYRK